MRQIPFRELVSPRDVSTSSSAYIRQLTAERKNASLTQMIHHCAARLGHLPALHETSLYTFYFGVPKNLPAALRQIPPDTVLRGNLEAF